LIIRPSGYGRSSRRFDYKGLKRIIPTVAAFGGAILGLLSVAADLMGAIGAIGYVPFPKSGWGDFCEEQAKCSYLDMCMHLERKNLQKL
jgi:hypothetical protein